VAACFTFLQPGPFLKFPKRWKSHGPILPTRVVVGYGATAGRLWTALPSVLIAGPVISDLIFLCRVFVTVFSKALVS
jgi:hypothetical protein